MMSVASHTCQGDVQWAFVLVWHNNSHVIGSVSLTHDSGSCMLQRDYLSCLPMARGIGWSIQLWIVWWRSPPCIAAPTPCWDTWTLPPETKVLWSAMLQILMSPFIMLEEPATCICCPAKNLAIRSSVLVIMDRWLCHEDRVCWP